MRITKINIENYKCFQGKFTLELNPNVNILVGNNESGKSTILEAINLALTGILNGKYLRSELSPYLFNYQTSMLFINSLTDKNVESLAPPHILIEIFFNCNETESFKGNGNSERSDACGLALGIEFDPEYQREYEALIKTGELKTIPIEYYRIVWRSFARDNITSKSIPMKAVLIDSSSERYQNGSDIYISRIIQADLEENEKAAIIQEYRKLKEQFSEADAVKSINEKIKTKSKLTNKTLSVSVDMTTHNSWQTTLMTYLDSIPFQYVGKGEQCIIKTNLALGHKKSKEANLILLEEPENHLSHTRLNQLLVDIEAECKDKQIIITTHSSFVANKLGFDNIIILGKEINAPLKTLPDDTYEFFMKLPGYQTLRLLFCKKAILVEGPTDELIFQKAYMKLNNGKLPIQDSIDVISVGLSFKRFLEIARLIHQPTAVITDNDSDYKLNIINKYGEYDALEFIKIFADDRDGNDGKDKLNTLEPQFLNTNLNNLEVIRDILGLDSSQYNTYDDIVNYMLKHKTEWALKIFETEIDIDFPEYIVNAVKWCNE